MPNPKHVSLSADFLARLTFWRVKKVVVFSAFVFAISHSFLKTHGLKIAKKNWHHHYQHIKFLALRRDHHTSDGFVLTRELLVCQWTPPLVPIYHLKKKFLHQKQMFQNYILCYWGRNGHHTEYDHLDIWTSSLIISKSKGSGVRIVWLHSLFIYFFTFWICSLSLSPQCVSGIFQSIV